VRRRRQELALTQGAGAPAVSRSTVSLAETRGTLPSTVATRGALARMLRWESDACDRLERGEEPVPVETEGPDLQEIRALLASARLALDVLSQHIDSAGQ
jgi:hypothetical protein